MAAVRFVSSNPFIGLLGCLLIILLIPLLPFLLLIFFVFLIFGRNFSIRKQYERFRDSRFNPGRPAEQRTSEDPDVCDVECTVISTEPVEDDKK